MIYNGDSIYNEKTEYNLEEWKKVKNKYALNKFFLYVGNVHPRKNISIIIRAYKKYCTKIKEPFQLLIAGDFSWNTKEIEQEIAEFPYEGKIIVTGYVSDEELKYLYKYAECLVFPSRYEGFGLPILEAMSVGTRVITSNTSSMPEVAGGAALYLNDLDSYNELEILLEKIQNMSQNDKEIMINAGYIQSQKFSRRKCALAILKLFGDANNE